MFAGGLCGVAPGVSGAARGAGVAPAVAGAMGREAPGEVFAVVAYNVENLFDADGEAVFSDYRPDSALPQPYGPRMLLTKIENLARVLRGISGEPDQGGRGRGPAVILFQEFETDRTPQSTLPRAARTGLRDYRAFLARYADTSVEAMLTDGFDAEVAGLPVDALVKKYFEDNGLGGYHVVIPELPREREEASVHMNVVFTRFPVSYQRTHRLERARSILEVGLDVGGHTLVVFNNHWKSGASDAGSEDVRIQNADTLRARVGELLKLDERADIVVGGDLNTNYNQPEQQPGWRAYAIERLDPLPGVGDGLYNLWRTLPEGERRNELWRGRWNTLMHLLVSPGLFDRVGVAYWEGTFEVVRLGQAGGSRDGAGEAAGRVDLPNTEGSWEAPREWSFFGRGGTGYSDHLPVVARLVTGPRSARLGARLPGAQAAGGGVLRVDYAGARKGAPAPVVPEDAEARAGWLRVNEGRVYRVDGRVVSMGPPRVVLAGGAEGENGPELSFGVFAPPPELRGRLEAWREGEAVTFFGELDFWRGRPQFLVQDASWLEGVEP